MALVWCVFWVFHEELKTYNSLCTIVLVWCILPLLSVTFMGKWEKERCADLPLVSPDYGSSNVPFLIKASFFFLINSESNGSYTETGDYKYMRSFSAVLKTTKRTLHRSHLLCTIIHQAIKHLFEDRMLGLLIYIKTVLFIVGESTGNFPGEFQHFSKPDEKKKSIRIFIINL